MRLQQGRVTLPDCSCPVLRPGSQPHCPRPWASHSPGTAERLKGFRVADTRLCIQELALCSTQPKTSPCVVDLPHPSLISLQLPKSKARDVSRKAGSLEKMVMLRERVAAKATRALQATAQAALQKMEPLVQVSSRISEQGPCRGQGCPPGDLGSGVAGVGEWQEATVLTFSFDLLFPQFFILLI